MFTGTIFLLTALLEAAQPPATQTADADCRLTLRAREALFQDPELVGLNLGVSIHAGKAVLWGDVPAAELARKAENHVRRLAGVLVVKSELQVVRPDDPLKELLCRQPAKRPAAFPGRVSLLRRPAGTLTSQGEGDEAAIALLPPILVPATIADSSLLSAVEKLRLADPRFRGLLSQIDGGVVRLHGTVTRHEDVMELAQNISRIPGVERVILQDVKTPGER